MSTTTSVIGRAGRGAAVLFAQLIVVPPLSVRNTCVPAVAYTRFESVGATAIELICAPKFWLTTFHGVAHPSVVLCTSVVPTYSVLGAFGSITLTPTQLVCP